MKLAAWGTAMAVFGIFLGLWGTVFASPAATSPSAKIAHGKYLVENVGMCGDCHSPRDEKGEPIAGKVLRGTDLAFKPTIPMPVWADKAPNIAGLAGWTEDAAVKFLMTGIAYNDLPGRPPMPQYRLNREDAEAVVAYLKALTPSDK
jgi:mono/diheme cytochrome c family protein